MSFPNLPEVSPPTTNVTPHEGFANNVSSRLAHLGSIPVNLVKGIANIALAILCALGAALTFGQSAFMNNLLKGRALEALCSFKAAAFNFTGIFNPKFASEHIMEDKLKNFVRVPTTLLV